MQRIEVKKENENCCEDEHEDCSREVTSSPNVYQQFSIQNPSNVPQIYSDYAPVSESDTVADVASASFIDLSTSNFIAAPLDNSSSNSISLIGAIYCNDVPDESFMPYVDAPILIGTNTENYAGQIAIGNPILCAGISLDAADDSMILIGNQSDSQVVVGKFKGKNSIVLNGESVFATVPSFIPGQGLVKILCVNDKGEIYGSYDGGGGQIPDPMTLTKGITVNGFTTLNGAIAINLLDEFSTLIGGSSIVMHLQPPPYGQVVTFVVVDAEGHLYKTSSFSEKNGFFYEKRSKDSMTTSSTTTFEKYYDLMQKYYALEKRVIAIENEYKEKEYSLINKIVLAENPFVLPDPLSLQYGLEVVDGFATFNGDVKINATDSSSTEIGGTSIVMHLEAPPFGSVVHPVVIDIDGKLYLAAYGSHYEGMMNEGIGKTNELILEKIKDIEKKYLDLDQRIRRIEEKCLKNG